MADCQKPWSAFVTKQRIIQITFEKENKKQYMAIRKISIWKKHLLLILVRNTRLHMVYYVWF